MMNKILEDAEGCLLAPRLTSEQIRKYRESLQMTQREFASRFGVPLGTLRRWEQGENAPRAGASFLRLWNEVLNSATEKKPA
jgi:DNA-binding transcriptional regulator YiaG